MLAEIGSSSSEEEEESDENGYGNSSFLPVPDQRESYSFLCRKLGKGIKKFTQGKKLH